MTEKQSAHNGLVGGSSPSGPTSDFPNAGNDLDGGSFPGVGVESAPTKRFTQRYDHVSPEVVREFLAYDPETGVLTRRKRQRGSTIGQVAGCVAKDGYLVFQIKGRLCYAHRAAWAHFHGRWPAEVLDHINGVRSDNRIGNLREATQSQNLANRNLGANNKSGITGVIWHKRDRRWQAQITAEGECHYLGQFVLKADAEAAYTKAAIECFGEFAKASPPAALLQPFMVS